MPAADASNPIEAVRARLDGGRRWIKDRLTTEEGYCIAGASAACYYEQGIFSVPALQMVQSIAREQYPDRIAEDAIAITPFNDHPDTTWADVDAVLHKASLRWDEQRASS